MADTVQTAVYKMGLDDTQVVQAQQRVDQGNQKVVAGFERVEQSAERVTAATRTTADGFARLEARYDPLIRMEQRREAALQQANRYVQEGAVSQERYAAQIQRVNMFYDQQVATLQRGLAANTNFGTGIAANTNVMSRFGSQIRQAGFQVGDFAVQMASGTNPIVAFTQQGSQLIQMFGPLGAVLGAAISILGAAAVAFFKVGQSAEEARKEAQEYEKAIKTLNDVMLSSADASRAKEIADRAEAAGILAKKQALEEETAAQKAALAARTQTLSESGNLQRGRIRPALDQSLGNNATGAGPGQDALAKLNGDLFVAMENARELQEQIDALNSGVNVREIMENGTKLSDYRQGLERQVELARMETGERKIQEELDRARKEHGKAMTPELEKQVELLIRQRAAIEKTAKAEEERAKFLKKIIEDADDAIQKQVEADAKRNVSVEKYIAGLENAAERETLSGIEKETQRAILEAQNKLIDDQGNKVRDLTDAERERITVAVRTKEQIEEQRKAYEKLTKDIERATERTLDNISDAAGDILFDYMEGRSGNFWETFERLGKRAFANLVAESVTQSIFKPFVQGAVSSAPSLFGIKMPAGTSGSSGGGVGGLGGLMPGPSSFSTLGKMFGIGGGLSSGSSAFLTGILTDFGGPLGGTGGASTGMFSSLFSSGASASAIESAVIAETLAAGGSVSPVVAGAGSAGTAASGIQGMMGAIPVWGWIALAASIAKQFVGGSDPRSAKGVVNTLLAPSLDEWMADPGRSFANSINPVGLALGDLSGNRTVAAILNPFSLLGKSPGFSGGSSQIGINADGTVGVLGASGKRIDVGAIQADSGKFTTAVNELFAGLGITFGNRNTGYLTSIGYGQGFSSRERAFGTLLGYGDVKTGVPSLDARITAMGVAERETPSGKDLGVLAQEFAEMVSAFKTIESMKAPANEFVDILKEIAAQFDPLIAAAKKWGAAAEDIALIEQRRAQSIEQAKMQIMSPFHMASANIVDFLNAQSLSPTSSLSPLDRLAESQRQFGTVLDEVRGGNAGMLGGLTQSAGTVLGISRDLYGSTSQGAAMERWVRESLLSVAELFNSTSFQDKQIAAIGQQTQIQQDGFDRMVKELERLRTEVVRLRSDMTAAAA